MRLLDFVDHVFDGGGDFAVGQIEAATLGWHVTGFALVAVDGMSDEGLESLFQARGPGSSIAEDRRAANTGAVAGEAGRVVDLRARQRLGNGLGLLGGSHDLGVRIEVITRHVDAADGPNTISDR